MSQRNSGYIRKENDAYYTPAWVTEALINSGYPFRGPVWEPACGNGNIVDVLKDRFQVVATDRETSEIDFLKCDTAVPGVQSIITNPPYSDSAVFIAHAIKLMEPRGQVAMLLRTDYDHASSRKHLFGKCQPFAAKLVLTKRIVWFVEANGKPKAAPSFNHAWYIWDWAHEGRPYLLYAP